MSTPAINSHVPPAADAAQARPFYPLDEFYAQAGRELPKITFVTGPEVPEPYRSLLVHGNDMTPTLENFYCEKIQLDVLRRQQVGEFYFREVVLLGERTGKRVEFGAIKIDLRLFEARPRELILEGRLPLGQILHTQQVRHDSRPKAFLRLQSDTFIREALHLEGDPVLYGRRNTLWNPDGLPLAEIVEILPAAETVVS